MNPLDISEMKSEAKELNIKGGIVNKDSATFSSSLDKFHISKSLAAIDAHDYIPKKQEKISPKGRLYGELVRCENCGAKNVTLYNINNKKICKKCKKENY